MECPPNHFTGPISGRLTSYSRWWAPVRLTRSWEESGRSANEVTAYDRLPSCGSAVSVMFNSRALVMKDCCAAVAEKLTPSIEEGGGASASGGSVDVGCAVYRRSQNFTMPSTPPEAMTWPVPLPRKFTAVMEGGRRLCSGVVVDREVFRRLLLREYVVVVVVAAVLVLVVDDEKVVGRE